MGEIASRLLPDGRRLSVIELTFGRGRLCIQQRPDDMGYEDVW